MAKKIKKEEKTFIYETFNKPTLPDYNRTTPACFNGLVWIKKYRVTIEEIEEPKEVLSKRLQALWDKCDSHHNWSALRQAAVSLGYELEGKPGSKR